MTDLTITIYTRLNNALPAGTKQMTWDEFCDDYPAMGWVTKAKEKKPSFAYTRKQDLPLWSPVKLRPGATRGNKNVEEVYALCLDFDGTAPVDDVESLWSDCLMCVHTTWSHSMAKPHARVIIALSRPVSAEEHSKLIRWAMARCEDAGLQPDPSCKDASRSWFMPAPSPEYAADYQHVVYYEGDEPPLDVDAVLKGAKNEPPGERKEGDCDFEDLDGSVHSIYEWGDDAKLGDKIKGCCPYKEGSSPGSAFLRKGRSGVLLVCTSAGHGHPRNPMKWWFRTHAAGAHVGDTPVGGPQQDVLEMCEQVTNSDGAPIGVPKATSRNLYLIMKNDDRWRGRIWEDDFKGCLMMDDREYEDTDDTRFSLWVDEVYTARFSPQRVADIARLIARENLRNPLEEHLRSLTWDGEERLDVWMPQGLRTADTALNREIGRRWMIQAVARALEPGCKADTVLILIGRQGAKKSTALRTLAGEDYFSDTPMDFGSANAYTQIRRTWIYEVAELDSIKKTAHSSVKAFLSAQHDTFRPAYGRHAVTVKRRVVFAGTTNEISFLSDVTGNRRYWPCEVGDIDLTWIAENKDQLWAEAVAMYQAGERWWLTGNAEDALTHTHKKYESDDPWEQLVLPWLQERTRPFTIQDALSEALRLDPYQMNKKAEMRLADMLRRLGCKRFRQRVDERRLYFWSLPESTVAFDEVEAASQAS